MRVHNLQVKIMPVFWYVHENIVTETFGNKIAFKIKESVAVSLCTTNRLTYPGPIVLTVVIIAKFSWSQH